MIKHIENQEKYTKLLKKMFKKKINECMRLTVGRVEPLNQTEI